MKIGSLHIGMTVRHPQDHVIRVSDPTTADIIQMKQAHGRPGRAGT